MRTRVLTKWANDWRQLKAWSHPLTELDIEISDTTHARRAGTCWPLEHRMVVYNADSIVEDLVTILHEMAHASTMERGHSEDWQATFSAAIKEVTGIPVPAWADNYLVLDRAGATAIGSWWESSGNAFAWNLLNR